MSVYRARRRRRHIEIGSLCSCAAQFNIIRAAQTTTTHAPPSYIDLPKCDHAYMRTIHTLKPFQSPTRKCHKRTQTQMPHEPCRTESCCAKIYAWGEVTLWGARKAQHDKCRQCSPTQPQCDQSHKTQERRSNMMWLSSWCF